MRICVALFGLNRSLPWTFRSIRNCLILPLERSGAEVKVYAHFNLPANIDNPRSGERVQSFENRGVELVRYDSVIVESQCDAKVMDAFAVFARHDLQCSDLSGATHRNLLHQFRSLSAVFELIERCEEGTVDAVLFARPDLHYLDRFPVVEAMSAIQENRYDLLTPQWHQWGGLNDRIGFCNWKAARVYANRLSMIEEVVSLGRPMNSEAILHYAVQKHALKNGALSMRGARVRSGGHTLDEGFELDLLNRSVFSLRKKVHKLRQALSY